MTASALFHAALSREAQPSIELANGITLVVLAVSGPLDDNLLRAITEHPVDAPAGQVLRLIGTEPAAALPGSGTSPARPEGASLLDVGPLRMDLDRVKVTLHGRVVELTHQEFLLLKAFMQNPGRVLSRGQLIEQAWDYGDWGTKRTVDAHVHRVRVKLGPDAPPIVTVRGFGYRLDPVDSTRGDPARTPSTKGWAHD